ncbi:hypothetical protein GJR96_01975 [Haloferax sp. MBLA0076]|uniref:DUF4383 domain-containing protein n=1 Tax=Haloferax litoreum TaxID=2666140 RepID=A0A6A8GCY1_9EURY|nr:MULTISPECIES: hypothetical protein [Haloferax]KAB1192273.1 hypothetical protein Hfx1148_01965 [Haloferax sp. CBA1148]MRX20731.1 hypothetical protein [Haloferax litoreum]
MTRQRILAVAVAIVGFAAIVVGIHQELLHVAPGYTGTIETGWSGPLNHGENLLARLAGVGVVGTLATLRWKYAAVVPLGVGGVEIGYSLVAVFTYVQSPGLYTTVQTSGGTTRFLLGAEPFLLVAGGLLLLVAGLVGWRTHGERAETHDSASRASSHA